MARPRWIKLLSSTSIQRSSQTASVIDGHAYIYGGEVKPREPVDSAVHRVPIGSASTAIASTIPTSASSLQPRVGHAATALNEKIYLFSGRGGIGMAPLEESGSFWVFDPRDDDWSQLHPKDGQLSFPAGRSYHCLTNDGKDTIFLHAGCPEKGRLRDLWAFNVPERRWSELPSAPGPERGGTSIAYAQGKIFRMNGFDGKIEQGGSLDVFDPTISVWNSISYKPDGISGPIPRSVSCLLSISVAGRPCLLTMFGECDPSSLGHQGAGKMLDDVWLFEIESETWRRLTVDKASQPEPRGWFGADVVSSSSSSIVIHGGLSESNDRLDDVWRLDL